MKKQFLPILILIFHIASFHAQTNRANTKKSVPYRANYQRISSGSSAWHTLEIREGTLWACGLNTYGQLGDGTTTNRINPVQVETDNKWVIVKSGNTWSLGLKSDGTLWSWGRNHFGQLGDGTTTNRNIPVQIGTDANWVSIEVGGIYSFGLKSDGTLWAWGWNQNGQLGDGTTTTRYNPVQIGTDNKWVAISGGAYHALGLKSNGTLWAWGRNVYGGLGDGTIAEKSTPVQIGTDNKWVNISAGSDHSFGLKSDGTLWSWGYNSYGQLGDGSIIDKNVPIQIGIDNKWVSITSGIRHGVGLKSDGTLWAWGFNQYGQLGDGTLIDKNIPMQIGTDNDWVSIAGGYYHSFGLKSDGTLWSWGYNNRGQLGDGTIIEKHSPIQISVTLNVWLSISGGGFHTLGLKSNGTLCGWGDNTFGQLGDGTTIQRLSSVKIGSDNKWISIGAGEYHSIALKSDGTLWAWGYNTYGQLGDGGTTNKSSPEQIGLDTNWLTIAAGGYHSLGLKSDGTLWAWGWNLYGELGDGTTVDKTSAVQIGTDNKWISVAGGRWYSFGLKSDGTLWAWGDNRNGQLGDGTTVTKTIPVQIETEKKWVTIEAGYHNSLGLKSDGTLWAWGDNTSGQLGDGTTLNKTSPVQIGTDNKWIGIGVNAAGISGIDHSNGLKSDGTLWAWGQNDVGQLGDGANTNQSRPLQVGAGDNWVSIAAGGSHCIGLKSDRNQFCATGDNTYGQLGDGTTVDKNSFTCIANTINCISPAAPSAQNKTICSGNTASLSATGISTLGWYSAATGGTYLGGANYITPKLITNITYYVQDSTCAASTTRTAVLVTVNALPIVTAYATATTVCAGRKITLIATGASSYAWSGGVTNGNSFVPSSTTTYTVTGTDGNSCSNTGTITINVKALPTITAYVTATTVCAGAAVSLMATGANSYTWTNGVNNGISFVPSSTKTYTVIGTDGNSCSSTSSITVSVKPLPDVTTNISGVTITANQNGAVYQWLDCNNGNSPIVGETDQNYTATTYGNYAVLITLNDCSAISTCVNINTVGVNEIANNNKLSVYPNPSGGMFTIESTSEGNYSIINELGQTIQQVKLNAENNYTVNIENLSNGIYFIVGFNNNQMCKQKIVITR